MIGAIYLMAIAFTNLGASAAPDGTSGTDSQTYSNASWTPPTTGIILLTIIGSRASGAADVPTVTGNSLTWTQIGTTVQGSAATRLQLFAALASGATAGATTIDFTPNIQSHCTFVFSQVTGADTSGGLAAAFVQFVGNTGAAATSGSVTLAAAANSNNRPFAAFQHPANEGKTPRTNWTELDDLGGSSNLRNLQTQYRGDAFETTASATWATSVIWAAFAVELKNLGGTTYNQAEAGTVTPAGVDVKRTNKVLAGAVTSSGANVKRTSKSEAGTVTPSGVNIKRAEKAHTGALTLSGVLSAIKIMFVTVGGTLTTAGNLARTTGKTLAGAVTSAGALLRQTNKLETGTITPAGALTRRTLKALAGAIAPAGNLAKRIAKVLAGALTTVGALATEKLGPLTTTVYFTLAPRVTSFTLAAARNSFTLTERSRDFTLAASRKIFTLIDRVISFTLEDK